MIFYFSGTGNSYYAAKKIAEATAALKVLGYTGKEIEKALEKVDANLSVEDIIRKGLLNLAR